MKDDRFNELFGPVIHKAELDRQAEEPVEDLDVSVLAQDAPNDRELIATEQMIAESEADAARRMVAEMAANALQSAMDEQPMGWDESVMGTMPNLINFSDLALHDLSAYEFVIDGAVSEGTVVFAGESGCGKSSLLVGMALCAAGLTTDVYQMKPTEARRMVVYAAEDVGQVRRIIASMQDDGTATKDVREIKRYFKLVESKRQAPSSIIKAGPIIRGLEMTGQHLDGSDYPIEPLVVLDTTNANIDLSNENDNAEVGKAIATLREGFRGCNLWLVAHTAKASGSDKPQSARGASAFKGDVQQMATMYWDSTIQSKILDLTDKVRGELDHHYFALNKRTVNREVTDKRGHRKTQALVYSDPHPITREMLEAERQKKADAVKEAKQEAKREVIAIEIARLLSGSPDGLSKRQIRDDVTGSNTTIAEVLDRMVSDGEASIGDDRRYRLSTTTA